MAIRSEHLSAVSSDELVRVARSIRKDETPTTFHRVVVELGRRGTPVDYETLGHGDAEPARTSEVITRQVGAVAKLVKLFVVELAILLTLGLILLYLVW